MGIQKVLEYLERNGLSQKDLALTCKVSPQAISAAMTKGEINPCLADKMDRFTKGKLKYEELTDKPRPKKALRRKAFQKKEE